MYKSTGDERAATDVNFGVVYVGNAADGARPDRDEQLGDETAA